MPSKPPTGLSQRRRDLGLVTASTHTGDPLRGFWRASSYAPPPPVPRPGGDELYGRSGTGPFGKARRFDDSVALFKMALAQDPNSVNTKLGLLATYAFARRLEAEAALLKQTIDQVPDDFQITRRAIMVGQELGDEALIERGLAPIREHHPAALPEALKFLGREPAN